MARKYFETTDEQFNIFEKEVESWVEFFGINDAEVRVTHEEINDYAGGCCSGDVSNRVFWISLNHAIIDFGAGNDFSDEEIKLIAAHEVLELMFMPLRTMATTNNNYDVVDEQVHRLIRTLENVLLKPIIADEQEQAKVVSDMTPEERLEVEIAQIKDDIDELILLQDNKEDELEDAAIDREIDEIEAEEAKLDEEEVKQAKDKA